MKAARPTAKRRTNKEPALLTDPHLVALLRFMTYVSDDADGRSLETFSAAANSAHVLLSSQPLTSAFSLERDRPDIYKEVDRSLAHAIRHWGDPKSARRAFDAVQAAWHEEGPDTVDARHLTDIMPSYVEHSMLLGACLMYQLLKGGAR